MGQGPRKLEEWTLIIQKSTVIPPFPSVLFYTSMHDRCGIFPHNLIIATFPEEQLHHRLMIAATNTQDQVRFSFHYCLHNDYQHYRYTITIIVVTISLLPTYLKSTTTKSPENKDGIDKAAIFSLLLPWEILLRSPLPFMGECAPLYWV